MIRLRPYEKSDAKAIVSWIKDEVTFRKWCANRFDHYPITADELNAQYQECEGQNGFFVVTAVDDLEVVGQLFIRFLDDARKVARFGYVIVDDSKRGKGYGKKMVSLALQLSFEILKVDKVTLGVFENNPKAYHCYRSVGFHDAPIPQTHHLMLLGEDWECLDLEITQDDYQGISYERKDV